MQTRRFGRTNHMSTVAIFGGFALSQATQEEADRTMEFVIETGINHIDIAPSYGYAEERLSPWMPRERQRFFLGCKTTQRTYEGAAGECKSSLERLQTDYFDLYQIHAITTYEELDLVTQPGGALEALIEARKSGLTRFIGITGHGVLAPMIFQEALQRFDFDSVLFPINFIQFADPEYRRQAQALLQLCHNRDVGGMIIKSIAQGPWKDQPQEYLTWYKPFTSPEQIQKAVDFVLTQEVTGLCSTGDPDLLPLVVQACENFTPMGVDQQEALIASADLYEPIFV
jgi:aryl-alcohol dehydrogenase-like predicted oxidoreductase